MSSLRVSEVAGADRHRPAVMGQGRVLSWGEMAERARARVASFDRASTPVVIVPRRVVDDVALIYGLLDARIPFAPLHPRLTEGEREAQRRRLRPCPVGTAVVVFTSGSAGAPKGVVLSARALVASASASGAHLGWCEDDRWLLSMPLAHVGGLSILVRCLLARRCTVLAPEGTFDPVATAAQIDRDRVRLWSAVPTMLARMLELDWTPPPRLRAVLLGGAPAPPELLAAATDRGWPVLATYGLTETSSQVATQELDAASRGEPGAGRPLPGVELRVVEGRIEVRGPMLMEGYLDAPSPLLPGGWLPTGDLGRLDAQGRLHVDGRADDLIITGGENVSPLEIERALERCPGVRAACVYAVPDAAWGQRVAAAVVGDATVEALEAFARAHLAPHRRPRLWRRVPSLPMTASGKLDRRACAAATT